MHCRPQQMLQLQLQLHELPVQLRLQALHCPHLHAPQYLRLLLPLLPPLQLPLLLLLLMLLLLLPPLLPPPLLLLLLPPPLLLLHLS